jgi:hypothetical protein
MNLLQKIKGDDSAVSLLHPQAEFWIQKKNKNHWSAQVKFYYKKIYIRFLNPQGEVQAQENHDWDFDLDRNLIEAGIRAESPDEEATRMAKIEEHWFEKVEERFGRDWFDCVMYDYLTKNEMFDASVSQDLASIRDKVKQHPPNEGDHYYADSGCYKTIQKTFQILIHYLEVDLKYSESEVETILLTSIYRYLYDHHNLKLRSLWGF